MVQFGTLAPFHGRWYASIRRGASPGAVEVIDGELFDDEAPARAWLIKKLERHPDLLTGDSAT